MTDPTIRVYRRATLEHWPTYIGKCCREWVMSGGAKPGRCGICGKVPTYLKPDDGRMATDEKREKGSS